MKPLFLVQASQVYSFHSHKLVVCTLLYISSVSVRHRAIRSPDFSEGAAAQHSVQLVLVRKEFMLRCPAQTHPQYPKLFHRLYKSCCYRARTPQSCSTRQCPAAQVRKIWELRFVCVSAPCSPVFVFNCAIVQLCNFSVPTTLFCGIAFLRMAGE